MKNESFILQKTLTGLFGQPNTWISKRQDSHKYLENIQTLKRGLCLINTLLIIIGIYLTLQQSLYHMKISKLASDGHPYLNYVRHAGKSVQIKVSRERVKLWGMEENFRKRDLGKEWNYLEEITEKEIPGQVNPSHHRRNVKRWVPTISRALCERKASHINNCCSTFEEPSTQATSRKGWRVGVWYEWVGRGAI